MEAQPVKRAALFSEEQLDALQRLRTAFEQKLLDEDEYKAEKAKVLNATPAAPAPPPPADDDDDGFELVGVQTPAERAAESRRRAEAEGNVLEIDDDDDEPAAPAPALAPRAGRFRGRSADRRGARHVLLRHGRAARRHGRLRAVRRHDGVALRRERPVRPAVRLEPSGMKTFDMYHRCPAQEGRRGRRRHRPAAPDADGTSSPSSLPTKPPLTCAPSKASGPRSDARKYIVIELGATSRKFARRPASRWGGHLGHVTAPDDGRNRLALKVPQGRSTFTTLARGRGDGEGTPSILRSMTKWSRMRSVHFSPSACARSRRTSAPWKASSPPTTRGAQVRRRCPRRRGS